MNVTVKAIYSSLIISICALVCSCHRQAPVNANQPMPSALPQATAKSQLTLPGSKPFHLKARVLEATNPENDSYNAEIEEYWVSPDKWRRTVRAESFSSVLVVNGKKQTEFLSGNYYPNWLRTLVSAIFEPGSPLGHLDLTAPSDNPMPFSALSCRRFASRVGAPPAENHVFSTVCFDGDKLESIGLPGYHAEYRNYKDFHGKQVPRIIREYIEEGTELEATINELTELPEVDESMFLVTPPAAPALQTVAVTEETLRKSATTRLDMIWPPIRGGKTEGVLSIYVCLDRSGKVRESYALNSDHPEMSDAARKQVADILFLPKLINGEQAQVEGILTFAYKTAINDPYPELTDEQARQRVISFIKPSFPPSVPRGTIVTVTVLVGLDGKVASSGPFVGLPAQLGSLAPDAAGWTFRPLLKDGKPTPFNAVLKFMVQ